ncbi:MAG: AzlD domain-containing protein [Pseudomonadota bacterium]
MSYSDFDIWGIIAALGVGTFLIRYSFLGLVGDRDIPEWLLRHLRYTPAAILPGLVAPLVLWPEATGGVPDPSRLAAAFVTVAVAYLFKGTVRAIAAGALTLYGMQYVLG